MCFVWLAKQGSMNKSGGEAGCETGELRMYFFEKTAGIFRFVTLRLEIPDKQPLDILQNCVTPLGNSKLKNQDPWIFHIIFS